MSRRPRQPLPSPQRMRLTRTRRNVLVAGLLLIVLLMDIDVGSEPGIGAAHPPAARPQALSMPHWALPSWAPPTSRAAAPPPETPDATAEVYSLTGDYPGSGPGTWQYAGTAGPVLGAAGPVRRFRLAIETGVPEDLAAFTATVDRTLGDPRSWIGGRAFRLQRVPPNARAEFTIHLATPETTRRLCAAGGLDVRLGGRPYTSCRLSGRVILNLARWRESTPEYVSARVPLELYRQYLINHEVGHQVGYRHELCPGRGRPAPVMQTQTLGLRGCTPNPWPYLGGRRYAGRPA